MGRHPVSVHKGVTAEQAAWVLNCQSHDIPALVAAKLVWGQPVMARPELLAIMMMMAANAKVMGEFTISLAMRVTGWGATLVIALAVIGMAFSAWV